MTDTPAPDRWHAEVETDGGGTAVTPTLVGEPVYRPQLNGKPSAQIPLGPTERYFDPTWDEADLRLYDGGDRVAIDLLARPTVGADGTTLHATGGRELDKRVATEVDEAVATDVIRDLVQDNTSYATNVDDLTGTSTADTLYIGGYDGNIYALDASAGTQDFATGVGSDIRSPSPTVVGGTVYVGDTFDAMHAIDASSGSVDWSTSYAVGVTSPTVVDGALYHGAEDGNVYSLDPSDGSQNWSFSTGASVDSTPTVDSGTVYIGSNDNNVYAINASAGTEDWSFTAGATVSSSPTVEGGVVYAGSFDGNLYALDAAAGSENWSFNAGEPVLSSPAVVDGVVYVGDNGGTVYALDAATGAEQWTFTANDATDSSPTVARGMVYIGSDDGNVYALNATDGSQEWTFAAGGSVPSSPTVSDGTVYFGSHDDNVYAVDAAAGTQEWSFTTNGLVGSSATVVTDTNGDSIDSRVAQETLGHRNAFTYSSGPSSGPAPVIRDTVFEGDLADVLTTICERYDLVWELRYDRSDGFVVECTRPGERPAVAIAPPVLSYSITKRNDQLVTRAIVEGSPRGVRGETITAQQDTAVALDNDTVVEASERVADQSSGVVYERGTDYVIDYTDGEIIALSSGIGSGAIADGQGLLVDYEFRPRADEQRAGHSGDARHELKANFPELTTVEACRTVAEVLLSTLSEPYYEGSVEIAPGARSWSLVDELDIAGVPGPPMETRGAEASDRGIQLQQGSRDSISEVVSQIRSQLDAVVETA